MPTIYSIADKMAFLDFNLRYWEWNHIEACHDRLTYAPDGFPVRVWRPSNRFLARLLKSGKYKDVVVKGHLTIAIGPGFPIHYTGPHIGTRHDARIFQQDGFLQSRIKPGGSTAWATRRTSASRRSSPSGRASTRRARSKGST